MTNAYSTS